MRTIYAVSSILIAVTAITCAAAAAESRDVRLRLRWHYADGRQVRWDRRVPHFDPDFRGWKSCDRAVDFAAAWPVSAASCQRLWDIYQKGWRMGALDPRLGLCADDCAYVEKRACAAYTARAKQVCNGLRRYVEACRAAGIVLVADDPRARLEESLREMGEILERARANSRRVDNVDGGGLPDGGAR